MKRRIVRITAGALIVLAWLAAGVYAFWGPKKEGEPTPPAIDPQQMSQQIAAANVEKPETLTPVASIESSPATTKPVATKPASSGLFSPSKVAGGSSFKPRANSFQPPSTPPDQPSPSVYGNREPATETSLPTDDENLAPEADLANNDVPPEVDVSMGATEADSGYKPNPLRDATSAYGAEETASAEIETAPEEAPLAPPPSRFGPAAGAISDNAAPAPAPNPRPASTFGGNRFAAPPSNTLPAETADSVGPDTDTGYVAPPPARTFGGTRFGNTGLAPEEAASSEVAAAPVASAGIASPRPEQDFEGTQSPALVIEKLAPAEIQVGKPARFEIHVRNAGQTAAQQVIVTDHVPAGTKFLSAAPEATPGAGGLLVWQLGTLDPGQDQTITLELMPQQEGEIGSVAQVTFAAAASVKTVCTKPMLTVEHIAPAKVMIGETVTLQITISNPGTGAATGVVLQEDVPEGLAHSAGKELEYEVGTLRPGESRKLELQLEAAKAGVILNRLVVSGDANLQAEHATQIEVIAPQLALEMNGPKLRYLDRQATYTVSIANPGTATARDVEIVAYLPKGMKFVSTDKEGQYDPQNHAVYWSLEELPPAQQGSAQLVAIPFETGEQKLRVEGHAQQNLTASDEELITVEAIPQLAFEIIDEADPIEVGADTIYQIRVTNEGSKAATNVQVAAALPPELKPVSADGATRGGVQGQNVIFEPLGKLAPQAEAVFKIQATGVRSGQYTIRVQVGSDDLQTPVTKEEPTRVYADR